MIWLLYIINIAVWIGFGIFFGLGFESVIVGIFYFIVGLPLSFFFLKISDGYSVSLLDKIEKIPFNVLLTKLAWANGVTHLVLWVLLFLITLIIK